MSTPQTPRQPPRKKFVLPNVRKLIIPDPGYTIFEADLAGADAQVVAWEADDHDLKAAFRAGLDVHDKNAEDMWGSAYTSLERGTYARESKRKQNKIAVHLTNYGGSARTLAISQGWTIHEAERFQQRWFSLHPGIARNFHGRVQRSLEQFRTVSNQFGFRRVFFDRIDACFTEGLAWIPQSTVAIVTYLGALDGLEKQIPEAEVLLQVHDSIVFQIPTKTLQQGLGLVDIRRALQVVVPYDDPLIIPWGLSMSDKSWGDCVEVAKGPLS